MCEGNLAVFTGHQCELDLFVIGCSVLAVSTCRQFTVGVVPLEHERTGIVMQVGHHDFEAMNDVCRESCLYIGDALCKRIQCPADPVIVEPSRVASCQYIETDLSRPLLDLVERTWAGETIEHQCLDHFTMRDIRLRR